MNNGESIKKYNDLLIRFLNDLVNSIDNPDNNKMFFEDIANRLKQQLNTYNLDIAADGIKTMMNNAFKEYSNILKKHFDSSNIHRIDVNIPDENISNEMNTVTANLANAVTNMNKIAEYVTLIDRIKGSLKGYFSQTYPTYQSIEFEVEQILNEVILGSFNTYTSKKIDDFTKIILPDLYTIADSITYDHTVHLTEENTYDINLERDNFIRDTMDIEIEEGFENGMVTLKVTDDFGKTTVYYSTEAMEKLTGYNQLFESSRPGKKVDTSNWELDKSRTQVMEEPTPAPINNSLNNDVISTPPIIDNNVNDNLSNNNISNDINNSNNDNATNSSENLIKDFLNSHTNNSTTDSSNSLVDIINVPSNDLNNSFNSVSSNIDNNSDSNFTISNDEFGSFTNTVDAFNSNDVIENNTSNQMEEQKNLINSIVGNDNISNNTSDIELTNNINNDNAFDTSEKIIDENIQKVRNSIGTNDTSYSSGFMFLPEFESRNQDRNEFIHKTTGMEIDEDTDNNGRLYLKVVEPTGREQIYTGKEAVRMIKNFNKVYLDSNPDKSVDTSLIDNFNEE